MINGAYIVEERDDRLFPHNINRSCLDGWVNADRYPARTVKDTPGDHDTSALTDKAARYRESDTGRATTMQIRCPSNYLKAIGRSRHLRVSRCRDAAAMKACRAGRHSSLLFEQSQDDLRCGGFAEARENLLDRVLV